MQDKLGRLIKLVYKKWKSDSILAEQPHPDEEEMACFCEGKLSGQENNRIKLHLLSCDNCAEAFVTQFRLTDLKDSKVPEELINRMKNLIDQKDEPSPLEIFLQIRGEILELIDTAGDVLVGQELVPAPILRTRKIKDFKDEITIFKDFEDVRVQIKIENKGKELFDFRITVIDKNTQAAVKGIRVTVLKNNLELESYLSDTGVVKFEQMSLGSYTLEITCAGNKLATLLLDIKT